MQSSPRKARHDGGFTLLEALVALVILSVGLLVFYEFLSGSLRAADRVRNASDAYDRDRNALALASTINPMMSPEGVLDLGRYRIRWRSERITAMFRNTNFPAADPGQFTIALYRMVLDFPDDLAFAPVVVTKLGYNRQTSSPTPSREP